MSTAVVPSARVRNALPKVVRELARPPYELFDIHEPSLEVVTTKVREMARSNIGALGGDLESS